jgi:hypothetical protein
MSLSSLAQLTRTFLGGDHAELSMTLAETGRILQAAAVIGPRVAGRSAARRDNREHAHLAFQKAAHDIAGWADYLAVLAVASRDRSGRWTLGPSMCAEAVRLPGGRRA